MKKKIILLTIFLIVAIIGVFYLPNKNGSTDIFSNESKMWDASPLEKTSKYKYTENYTNPVRRFSFNHPKEFAVTSILSDGIEIVLIQNADKKIGVQIVISPFLGEDLDITPEIIRTDIPEMKIDAAKELIIAPSRKGLSFESDNPAFGGQSSEIWFVFKGNLYQLSTYYEFKDFLQGLFATWKFQ
jgi:hypothetical protein